MGLKGYLPPEEPHSQPYQYNPDQEAHRLPQTVIYGPGPVILTGDPDAQGRIEDQMGLEEINPRLAERCLASYQAEDPYLSVQEVLDRHEETGTVPDEEYVLSGPQEEQEDAEEAESEADGEEVDEDEDSEAPVDIPEERPEDYSDLQALAGEFDDISGNQSGDDIWEALQEKRGSD